MCTSEIDHVDIGNRLGPELVSKVNSLALNEETDWCLMRYKMCTQSCFLTPNYRSMTVINCSAH